MKTLQDFESDKCLGSNEKPKTPHIFEKNDTAALWAAYASGRPLLVRGKPGTGKSQMARAIAERLGWAFVSEVIRGDTELSDLHWHFDAVARLGEAQSMGRANADPTRLNASNFLSPGAFWWAYNWRSATTQQQSCKTHMATQPYSPTGLESTVKGVVLLIDEIDKANPDLPNGLLETIGNLEFPVPYLSCDSNKDDQESLSSPIKASSTPLLIVITTNEERELPQAFVRRCFVHSLRMEDSDKRVVDKAGNELDVSKREQWLIDRGRLHFAEKISENVYRKAAKLLWDDRKNTSNKTYPPGLAEYIDLLRVLEKVPTDEQTELMDTIASYAFEKELMS